MTIDWSILQGAELFYRLVGLTMFVGTILGMGMYMKARGPEKTNFSWMANLLEETMAILVPGMLMVGIVLMIIGTPGGGILGSPTP